jgi:hypothetical protein
LYITQASSKLLRGIKKGTSSIEIKKSYWCFSRKILAYIDSICSVDEKLMFDIAKTSTHGDEELLKLYKEAFIKESTESHPPNVVLPTKLISSILQEIQLIRKTKDLSMWMIRNQ